MKHFIVKKRDGTFPIGSQPDGFVAKLGIENRFFICASEIHPLGDFVVEAPTEIIENFAYYSYVGGKKLPFDPFEGKVTFGEEVDKKNRREIQYSPEQLALRLSIMKWLMLNVWLPDAIRMLVISEADGVELTTVINALTDDTSASAFIKQFFYYDL